MPKEYLAFVSEFGIESLEDLDKNKEIDLVVKDLTPGRYKYESRYVRARISTRKKLPDGDILWIRYQHGQLYPEQFTIQITKELGELPVKTVA